MVTVVNRHQVATVYGEKSRTGRAALGTLWIKQHIVHRIAEGVLHRAFAAVKGFRPDPLDSLHAAIRVPWRSASASTTSTAEAKPSS